MTGAQQNQVVFSTNVNLEAAFEVAQQILPDSGFVQARDSIKLWHNYSPTPLIDLPGLAKLTGVAQISVKDESSRFGLGSFKALGGSYAVYCLLIDRICTTTGRRPDAAQVMAGDYADLVGDIVVTCTTDGNHGRSVAWGAARFGCRCVIYVHEGVTEARAEAIRSLGAEVVRAGRTYDESVEINARDAAERGWNVVADTSVEDAPPATVAIMQGYRLMVEEAVDQLPASPTHVILQVGCGGFAAAVTAHLLGRVNNRPCFIAVEPETAACLAPSVLEHKPTAASGNLETLMAGLSVGQMSKVAWEILSCAITSVIVIPDEAAATAMRILADGANGDPSIVAGESGAAGLAGLLSIADDESARLRLGLDHTSRVLLVNTEGATDPAVYRELVGRPPASQSLNENERRKL